MTSNKLNSSEDKLLNALLILLLGILQSKGNAFEFLDFFLILLFLVVGLIKQIRGGRETGTGDYEEVLRFLFSGTVNNPLNKTEFISSILIVRSKENHL